MQTIHLPVAVRLGRVLRILACLAVFALGGWQQAVATEAPWQREFNIEHGGTTTSEMTQELGRSTMGVAQWIASGVMAIIVLLLIIYAAFQFSRGQTQAALFGIGGILLIALLMGLATRFIFGQT